MAAHDQATEPQSASVKTTGPQSASVKTTGPQSASVKTTGLKFVENKFPWVYYPGFVSPDYGPKLYEQVKDLVSPYITSTRFYDRTVNEWVTKEYQARRISCIFNTTGGYVDESGLPYHPWSASSALNELKQMIEIYTGETFDYALFHIYRDGTDNIAYHRDREATSRDGRPGSSVVSLSFGATRKFRFRSNGQKSGWVAELELAPGTLVWMLPGCQDDYLHSVPVQKLITEWRINITFRHDRN